MRQAHGCPATGTPPPEYRRISALVTGSHPANVRCLAFHCCGQAVHAPVSPRISSRVRVAVAVPRTDTYSE